MSTGREFPAHEFFYGAGVGYVISKRGEVIETIGVGHKLVVVHVLRDLFVTTMQVTDVGLGFLNDFPIQLENEAQDTVGGGVGWSHVQHHFFTEHIVGFGLIIVHSFRRYCGSIGCLVSRRLAHSAVLL